MPLSIKCAALCAVGACLLSPLSGLALSDVTGDGVPEILAGAFNGDQGYLFILSWDKTAVRS